jgi:hypothetical protein
MKYCCQCAAELSNSVLPGDTHERMLCSQCGYVAYENPKILVACFATWGETAYPQVRDSIEQFYTDHRQGNYGVYRASYFDDQHTLNSVQSR